MTVQKQVAKAVTKYRINIFHTRLGFPENVVFLKFYLAKASDKEELLMIFYRIFESAHPNWTIKEVEALPVGANFEENGKGTIRYRRDEKK